MSKFLIHIHSGPENPTKAALGFLVALSALKKGHAVEGASISPGIGKATQSTAGRRSARHG